MKKRSLKYLIILCLLLPGIIPAQSKTVSEFAQKIQTSLAKHKYISAPLPAGDEVNHLVKRREIKNIRKVRQVFE